MRLRPWPGSQTTKGPRTGLPEAGGTTVVNTPTMTFANAVTQVGMPVANLIAQLSGLGGATADTFAVMAAAGRVLIVVASWAV